MMMLGNGGVILTRLVIFFYLIVSFAFAQENEPVLPTQPNGKITKAEILQKLQQLEGAPIEEFLKEMKKIGKISTEYIRQRDEECSGVYSTITTNEKGEQVEQKKKLSRKEKKLCKYLLINFQIELANITFKLRKSYLKQLHEEQLAQLNELTQKRLAELETLAGQYK